MIAEDRDSSIALLDDRVVVSKSGTVTADVPIDDVYEVRYKPAGPFSEGHLQILTRKTVIDGMKGTVFFKGVNERSFDALSHAVKARIDKVAETRTQEQHPSIRRPTSLRIMLASGNWVQVDQVRLYSAEAVAEIQRHRAQAAKTLGGGPALGVLGSPGLVFAAEAAAVSVISMLLASANQRQAADGWIKAQKRYLQLIESEGIDVPVRYVDKIELPNPAFWQARRNGIDMVHSGDEFVSISTPQAAFSVRWSDVALFQPQWPQPQ
jgi:hypothetical protein